MGLEDCFAVFADLDEAGLETCDLLPERQKPCELIEILPLEQALLQVTLEDAIRLALDLLTAPLELARSRTVNLASPRGATVTSKRRWSSERSLGLGVSKRSYCALRGCSTRTVTGSPVRLLSWYSCPWISHSSNCRKAPLICKPRTSREVLVVSLTLTTEFYGIGYNEFVSHDGEGEQSFAHVLAALDYGDRAALRVSPVSLCSRSVATGWVAILRPL